MENRRKIIMDCDPGIDDAVALALAAAHQESFEILGITTVAGNQTIEKVTENALRLVEFYGLDVPVARGASTPVVRRPLTASDIHGGNGLGNVEIPAVPGKTAADNAVLFIRELIGNLPEGEKVTLIPTGPLTNIALLFRVFPEVKDRIEEIVLMGGAVFGGNVTAAAEFNIYEDPEAAAIVFDSGLPIVMCGLTATKKCGMSRGTAAELSSGSGRIGRAVGNMIRFYLNGPAYGGKPMASIHDAVTFMYLLHPEIFRTEKMAVTVDCSDGPCLGMTVCDMRGKCSPEELTTVVLTDADGELFEKYLVEAICDLEARLAAG